MALRRWRRARKAAGRFIFALALLVGLYLMSYPAEPPQQAGAWYFMFAELVQHNKDGRRLYHASEAVLILGATTSLPVLRRRFDTALARYLGRISYALYLVHGPLTRVLGGRLLHWAWG